MTLHNTCTEKTYMLVKRQPISTLKEKTMNKVFPGNHVWFFLLLHHQTSISLIKIHIHHIKQNHYFFSSLPHFHSCDPFITSSTTRRKTPQVIIIFAKNL